MSVESEAFAKVVADQKREAGQIVPFITDLQSRLAQLGQQLQDAITAGATDKELADAVRASMPDLVQVVTDLDQFTPEGTPVITE